jgi:L-lactate utilization protein LutC
MDWNSLADDETIGRTAQALSSRGIEASVARDRAEARELAIAMIPQGAEVYAMSSVTLEECGIAEAIEKGGMCMSVRKKVTSIPDKAERERARRAASACQFAIGSVHAVTEEGQALIASQSGSQIAPYAFSAQNVIWVVGAQKIVRNLDGAFKRLREHVVPLEDARARKAYGVGTSVNKTLIFERETVPGRVRMIIVKERLGF